MIARSVFRQTTFNKRSKILVLEWFQFPPHGSWDWRGEKFSYVLLQPLQFNEHAHIHCPIDGVQIENYEFNEQPFIIGNGLIFQIHVRFEHAK